MIFQRKRERPRKGITVFVFRFGELDLSSNGLSSRHDCLVLTGPDIPQLVSPSQETPEVRLVQNTNPTPAPEFAAVPAAQPTNSTGPSRGGCFVFSADPAFPGQHPIPLLDRFDD